MVYLQQEEAITLENTESQTSPLARTPALSTNNRQSHMNKKLPPLTETTVTLLLAHSGEEILYKVEKGSLGCNTRL